MFARARAGATWASLWWNWADSPGHREMLETGSRIVLTVYTTCLAVAHQLAGALDEALEVAEQTLEINP